jgi:hypothetical protein
MTRSSAAHRSDGTAHARDPQTPCTAEGRSGSAHRPKTDKG